jgi:hypothetical protein
LIFVERALFTFLIILFHEEGQFSIEITALYMTTITVIGLKNHFPCTSSNLFLRLRAKIFAHQIIILIFFNNSRNFKIVKADFSGVKNDQSVLYCFAKHRK